MAGIREAIRRLGRSEGKRMSNVIYAIKRCLQNDLIKHVVFCNEEMNKQQKGWDI